MKYILPAISVIILAIIVGIGAFYLGQKTLNNSQAATILTITEKVNNQVTPKLTPTPNQNRVIQAGGAIIFSKYSLKLPEGWTSEREQGKDIDKLTLTKLGYKLVIYEAAFGGSGCLYPDDAPSEMAQKFVSFVEILNPNGFVFRRGQSDSLPNTYTICQKNTADSSFGSPTNFGAISLTTPGTPDKNAVVFPETDAIIASLNKE